MRMTKSERVALRAARDAILKGYNDEDSILFLEGVVGLESLLGMSVMDKKRFIEEMSSAVSIPIDELPLENVPFGGHSYSTCFECGAKYGSTPLYGIGMWNAVCCICGRDTICAATVHDFHINERVRREAYEKEHGVTFPEPDGKE
jgi:hypothetical protein